MLQLKPETEELVREAIGRGHFKSLDDLILEGVRAWREKHQASLLGEPPARTRRPEGRKSLAQLFAESPFHGLSMDFERFPDTLPPDDL